MRLSLVWVLLEFTTTCKQPEMTPILILMRSRNVVLSQVLGISKAFHRSFNSEAEAHAFYLNQKEQGRTRNLVQCRKIRSANRVSQWLSDSSLNDADSDSDGDSDASTLSSPKTDITYYVYSTENSEAFDSDTPPVDSSPSSQSRPPATPSPVTTSPQTLSSSPQTGITQFEPSFISSGSSCGPSQRSSNPSQVRSIPIEMAHCAFSRNQADARSDQALGMVCRCSHTVCPCCWNQYPRLPDIVADVMISPPSGDDILRQPK